MLRIRWPRKNSARPPSGVPGLETMLPLCYSPLCRKGGWRYPISRGCAAKAAAAVYGIRAKGRIAPGFDADLTLVNPDEEWVIGERPIFSKCGWTPFAGWRVRGAVKRVFVRGRLAFADERVIAVRGSGRIIRN